MRRFQAGDTVKRVDCFNNYIPNFKKGAIFKVAKLNSDGDFIDENGAFHWKNNVELVEPVETQSNLAFLARDFADLVQSHIEKPSSDNAKRINLVITAIQKELGGGDA